MKKGLTVIPLTDEEAEPLVLAATQHPYLIIAQDEDGGYVSTITEGFDMDALFHLVALYARENAEFKAQLADFVIDLSKEC